MAWAGRRCLLKPPGDRFHSSEAAGLTRSPRRAWPFRIAGRETSEELCFREVCLIDVASGLEFLDSAPSFADTEVQDTEAVDSMECRRLHRT
jgi:hypothetical protein